MCSARRSARAARRASLAAWRSSSSITPSSLRSNCSRISGSLPSPKVRCPAMVVAIPMPRAIARIGRYLIFMVLFVLPVEGERGLAVASFKGIDGSGGGRLHFIRDFARVLENCRWRITRSGVGSRTREGPFRGFGEAPPALIRHGFGGRDNSVRLPAGR